LSTSASCPFYNNVTFITSPSLSSSSSSSSSSFMSRLIAAMQLVYHQPSATARLFTDLGVEITVASLIEDGAFYVVSGGDDYIPLFTMDPSIISTILSDVHVRGSLLPSLALPGEDAGASAATHAQGLSALPASDTELFSRIIEEAVTNIYGPEYGRRLSEHAFPPAFAEMIEDVAASDPPELLSTAAYDAVTSHLFSSLALPALPVTTPTYTMTKTPRAIPQQSSSARASAHTSSDAAHASSPAMSTTAAAAVPASTTGPATRSTMSGTTQSAVSPSPTKRSLSESSESDEDSEPGQGRRRRPERIRSDSHKAAELRSRQRLRGSLQELALTVPSLSGKKASRADIIREAVDTIRAQQAETDRLQRESEKFALSSLVTVEITDADHRFLFVDHMWEIIFGYKRMDVIGQVSHNMTGCTRCSIMSERLGEIERNLRGGEEWVGLVLSKRRDLRMLVSLARVSPVLDVSGKVLHYVTTRKYFHVVDHGQVRRAPCVSHFFVRWITHGNHRSLAGATSSLTTWRCRPSALLRTQSAPPSTSFTSSALMAALKQFFHSITDTFYPKLPTDTLISNPAGSADVFRMSSSTNFTKLQLEHGGMKRSPTPQPHWHHHTHVLRDTHRIRRQNTL
jgi:PAS domain-containing protein